MTPGLGEGKSASRNSDTKYNGEMKRAQELREDEDSGLGSLSIGGQD